MEYSKGSGELYHVSISYSPKSMNCGDLWPAVSAGEIFSALLHFWIILLELHFLSHSFLRTLIYQQSSRSISFLLIENPKPVNLFSSFLHFDNFNQHSLETVQAYFSSLELNKSRFASKYFMLFREILVLLVHGLCIVSYNFSLLIFESVVSAIKASKSIWM